MKSVNLTSFNTALLYLEKNMYLVRGHSLNLSFAYSYKYCWFHHSLQLTVLINIHLFVLFYSGPASSRVKGPEKPIANMWGSSKKKRRRIWRQVTCGVVCSLSMIIIVTIYGLILVKSNIKQHMTYYILRHQVKKRLFRTWELDISSRNSSFYNSMDNTLYLL